MAEDFPCLHPDGTVQLKGNPSGTEAWFSTGGDEPGAFCTRYCFTDGSSLQAENPRRQIKTMAALFDIMRFMGREKAQSLEMGNGLSQS